MSWSDPGPVVGGSAVQLDGSTATLQAADSASLDSPTSAITLEAWVNPTEGGFSSEKPVMLKGYTSHTSPYYQYGMFLIDNGDYPDEIDLMYSSGDALRDFSVRNAGWQYGTWNHLVITATSTTVTFWVNGGLVSQQSSNGEMPIDTFDTPLQVGAFANLPVNPTYAFSGGLADLAVYNHALDERQVETHFHWSPYAQSVLDNSPVAFWPLDNHSPVGQNQNEIVHGSDLAASGGVVAMSSGPNGTGAVGLNGSTGYLSTPDAPALDQPTNALTLEAWVLPTAGDFTTQKPIVVKGYTSHVDPYYQYGLFLVDNSTNPNEVAFDFSAGGQLHNFAVDNAGWAYGTWNHVVATYDGPSVAIWVNGVLKGSQLDSGTLDHFPTPLVLGAYANLDKSPTYLFGGAISDVAVYDHALASAYIGLHAGSFNGPAYTGYQLRLAFSAGDTANTLTATTGADVAGSGYDIEIFDADTMTQVADCPTGTTCSGTDSTLSDRDFVAYVAAPSATAPPPDIQAEAVPDGMYSDLSKIGITGSEVGTVLPTGDPADAVVPRPSGDTYRDALFPYLLQAFNIVHGYALSLRANDAVDSYPDQVVQAGLGLYGFCNPGTTNTSGIEGAGPNGGPGYPDLTVTTAGEESQQLWEMKYDSANGRVKGAQQIARYVDQSNLNNGSNWVVAGAPFETERTASLTIGPTACPTLLPNGWGPIQVQVYSSYSPTSQYPGVPGLEVYKVSLNDIYELAAGLAAAAGITRNAIESGALRELRLATGEVQVLLNDVVVVDYVPEPGSTTFVVF